MKKIFLTTLVLAAATAFVAAQQQDEYNADIRAEYKVYCELHLIRGFNGCEAGIDLGAKQSNLTGHYDIIGDGEGGKRNFYSPVEILNYMSRRGWDIEYKVTNADSLSHGSYMLSKFVIDDSEIADGIDFAQRKPRKQKQDGKKD